LKTMSTSALREIHRIHQQLHDLNERLARGPKQVAAREANVARLKDESDKVHDSAKQTRVAADQKQLQLKSNEDKINDLKQKLNGCSSNREFQALKTQIAADEMANSVLEDEILEVLEKIEDSQATVAEADVTLEKGKQEFARAQQAVASKEESLRADIERLEADLKEAEQALPAEIRVEYNRMVRAKGAECMAQVEDNTCGGCFQSITTNMVNELQLSRMVFCKTCGCLLYLPELTSPGSST